MSGKKTDKTKRPKSYSRALRKFVSEMAGPGAAAELKHAPVLASYMEHLRQCRPAPDPAREEAIAKAMKSIQAEMFQESVSASLDVLQSLLSDDGGVPRQKLAAVSTIFKHAGLEDRDYKDISEMTPAELQSRIDALLTKRNL